MRTLYSLLSGILFASMLIVGVGFVPLDDTDIESLKSEDEKSEVVSGSIENVCTQAAMLSAVEAEGIPAIMGTYQNISVHERTFTQLITTPSGIGCVGDCVTGFCCVGEPIEE